MEEEDIGAIDNGVAWHYSKIAALKAKRNSLAPISSLPNELLSRILTIYAVESDSLFDLKWTKIMYVCRHWHALALAAQPLWAFISLDRNGISRVLRQISHSGVSPLTIQIAHLVFDIAFYIGIILTESERIYSLEVAGEAQHVYDFIGRIQNHSLPILSSLILDLSYKREELPDGFVQALPYIIFDGRLRSLRELSLKAVAFPWRLVSNLEVLCMTDSLDSSSSTPSTLGDLLSVLESCPQLHTLKLDSVIPTPIPDMHCSPVDLPFLAVLHLRGSIPFCTALLNHILLPATSTLEVIPFGVCVGADIKSILIPIRKHIRAPGAPRTSLLEIDSHKLGADRYSHYTISFFTKTTLTHTNPPLSINCHPATENAVRQLLSKVIKTVPFEAITHLDLCLAMEAGEVTWKMMLKLLPALQMVYLQANTGGINFVRVLTQMETTARKSTPHLRCLHIRFFRPWQGNDRVSELLEPLEEYFRIRRVNANVLQTVEFMDRDGLLSNHKGSLERLFHMMCGAGTIIRDGQEFDPVKAMELRTMAEEEQKMLLGELGEIPQLQSQE
ncbi:hypothetical protein GGX14DRAFT_463123 [Mycena pura]|uniref:F-box domain-containing protein n=1 Tax=Mycena pura TaxID=153505 RepID=A0AAD6V525_9AGAR|nr:hypothetical protein GGX14DRAFT_463123 [Mycena pura]